MGVKRKKELLLHFGTIQKIKSASLDELKLVKTIQYIHNSGYLFSSRNTDALSSQKMFGELKRLLFSTI